MFYVFSVDLIGEVYPRKPKQVFTQVSPLLWQLLQSSASGSGAAGNAQLKQATSSMILSLYSQMGEELVQAANVNSKVTPKMKSVLEDIIEHP